MCVMYVFVINDKRDEGKKEEKIYLYVLCIVINNERIREKIYFVCMYYGLCMYYGVYCVINKGKIRERGEREKWGEKKIWAEVYLYG